MTKFLNISKDNTLGGSNAADNVVSSQKAVKDYVDNHSGGSPAWGNITGTLSNQTDLQNALDLKAPLSSPAFTGTPTAPTPASAKDNSTNIPTTAWVRNHCCTTKATTTSTASKDAPAYVVENYRDSYNWYRVWSDGWIEQGGYASASIASTNQLVNLNKAFSSTNYCVFVTSYTTSNVADARYIATINQTTTSFKTYYACNKLWYACGY